MNFRLIFYLVAVVVFYLGLSMGLPLLAALYYNDGSTPAILISMLVTCGLGGIVFLMTRGHEEYYLNHRDGVAIVNFGMGCRRTCCNSSVSYLWSHPKLYAGLF